MRVLIVAATQGEIEPLILGGSEQGTDNSQLTTDLLITGVGMVATAFALGRHLAVNQYDLAINLGIAGTFTRSINLGEVVEVTNDIIAELGAEDGNNFLTIEDLGFGESVFGASTTVSNLFSHIGHADNSLLLKQVTGITVNSVHGNEQTIDKIRDRLNPTVESMEGAAFFYACKQAGLPCIQIRAVSNYVEKRDRAGWKIGLAIKNLNTFADALLKRLS